MQLGMMVSKLADAEDAAARLDRENEGLRDQLATVQFQSGMPTEGADDMERQARQCAEEQLALATQRLAAAEEALVARWAVVHHTPYDPYDVRHTPYDHLKGISPPCEPHTIHAPYSARHMAYGAMLEVGSSAPTRTT
jgi:hypothetical protein